jgi:hypothetical protein
MAKRRAMNQIANLIPNHQKLRIAMILWKTLNEGYNFASNLTSIGGLHTKLCTSQIARVLILKISGFPLGNPWTK